MLQLSQRLTAILNAEGIDAMIRAGVLTVNGAVWYVRTTATLFQLTHIAAKHGYWAGMSAGRNRHASQYIVAQSFLLSQ